MPTPDELKQDVVVRDFLRTAPDYLLKDLWNIVASFFFDHTNIISIPLCRVPQHTIYLYGREDGAEIEWDSNGMRMKVSGHYPLHVYYILPRLKVINGYQQQNDRFIIAVSTQPFDPPKNPITFVWHKDYSQTFTDKKQMDQFHKDHPEIPILQICNGLFLLLPHENMFVYQ